MLSRAPVSILKNDSSRDDAIHCIKGRVAELKGKAKGEARARLILARRLSKPNMGNLSCLTS